MNGIPESRRRHVIPVGDTGPHSGIHAADLGCWCHPLESNDGLLATHNAHDCREVAERAGTGGGGGWVLIDEIVRAEQT